MPLEFLSFADASAARLALTKFVEDRLRDAVATRKQANLVVSGGKSPVPFLQALSHVSLPWSAVTVLLADERCVPANHADSNTRLLSEHLLTNQAHEAKFFSLGAPEAAAPNTVIPLKNAEIPLDLVVLGMGEDGHTASIFPDSEQVNAALDPAAPLGYIYARSASAPHARLTLTARALNESRAFVLAIAGEKKRAVYERALKPGAVAELPIRLALHHPSVPCYVFWSP
jgi:6-phosphogluconolactonase